MVEINYIVERATFYLNTFFSKFLGKLIVAVIIVLIGFIVGRVLERIVHKLLHELELDRIMEKTGLKISLETVLSSLVAYLIYFLTLVMALNQLGLTAVVLYILVGAVVILILISIFLSIKDLIPNLVAGFFIHSKGLYKEGQKIKIRNIEGKVKKIGLIETEIISKKGDRMFIPNSLIPKSELVVRKVVRKKKR